ncbi:hypothetical protein EJ02DRAFT_259718 [Clathrospora elynae]|uniref:Uncharacterized protein n=1 Tax=Clathrospora elynae TaxID=706981 RepID=A0A6A5SHU4_9PLEO|nr:hypothetical protein EJ02DRAFT_259718 [Clathrospora elynae]
MRTLASSIACSPSSLKSCSQLRLKGEARYPSYCHTSMRGPVTLSPAPDSPMACTMQHLSPVLGGRMRGSRAIVSALVRLAPSAEHARLVLHSITMPRLLTLALGGDVAIHSHETSNLGRPSAYFSAIVPTGCSASHEAYDVAVTSQCNHQAAGA